jgi:acyl-CoA reductase-like NAD-dependent aldehyde dehydrogenase
MQYTSLINGQFVAGGPEISVINPATEEIVSTCIAATAEQVADAVAAAKAAFPQWSALSIDARKQALAQIAETTKAHIPEIASLLSQEQGKPMADALFEVGVTAGFFEYHAHVPTDALDPVTIPGSDAKMHRMPLGVVAAIVPFNFPLALMAFKLPGALVTGNTVVLKPSPTTPLSTIRWATLIKDALPPGVLNVVIDGGDVGPHLTSHPDVRKISFTGSTETGRRVMQTAAKDLKRLTLELGGNDPAIVLPDADVDQIASAIFDAAFMNNGQTCAAIKRVYVHQSRHRALVSKLAKIADDTVIGEGTQPDVKLGPVQNKRQFEVVKELLQDAVDNGAKVEAGGYAPQEKGYFLRPTILSQVRDGQRIVDEEQFGPILPVIEYSDVDAVIETINASPYALGASVWGADPTVLNALAQRVDTGSVWINKHFPVAPNVPFGGARQSGFGSELGAEGLLEFTQLKVIA